MQLSTTNNIAEMVAAIDALKAAPEGASVMIYLVSAYVKDGFEKYLTGWVSRGWRKSNGKGVANVDQWKQIIAFGPFALMDTKGRNRTLAATASEFRCRSGIGRSLRSSGATQIERELMDVTICGNGMSALF
ncbi:MAG: RNase H family protein [Litoreibacter sp.]|uniref:RNase H family protein n=1 Tax=Litoreibacter sp. TaxID=1969459 RepID=UPI003296D62E